MMRFVALWLSSAMLFGCSLDRSGTARRVVSDAGRDAARSDAGDAATADAGDTGPGVCDPSRCDDALACTADSCGADGACQHSPDDSACMAGGRCDAALGCQYPSCTATTCMPADGCSTAVCAGDTCMRASSCVAGQVCCGTGCAAPGCDDGDPCTDDACGVGGCEHVPNTAACDDGVFCNGADACSGGACVSAGDPCGGMTCHESSGSCFDCVVGADCTTPPPDSWSTCGGFSGTCGEGGTQSRTTYATSCVAGACSMTSSTESRGCSRNTDWTPCMLDGRSCTADLCHRGVCTHECRLGCSCSDGCSGGWGC